MLERDQHRSNAGKRKRRISFSLPFLVGPLSSAGGMALLAALVMGFSVTVFWYMGLLDWWFSTRIYENWETPIAQGKIERLVKNAYVTAYGLPPDLETSDGKVLLQYGNFVWVFSSKLDVDERDFNFTAVKIASSKGSEALTSEENLQKFESNCKVNDDGDVTANWLEASEIEFASFGMKVSWDRHDRKMDAIYGTCVGGLFGEGEEPIGALPLTIVSSKATGLPYKPIEVVTDSSALASIFTAQTSKSPRRLCDGCDSMLSYLETNEENRESETQFLTYLWKSLLGQNVHGNDNSQMDLPVNVDDLQSLNGLVSWARRWNGSDALGIIQFSTTTIFYSVMLLVLARTSRTQFFEKPHASRLLPSREQRVSSRNWMRKHEEIQNVIGQVERDPRGTVPWSYDALENGLAVWSDTGASVAATTQVSTRMSGLKDSCYSTFSMFKDLLYLLTTIGFLGTVIGIGLALGKAGGVLVGDQAAKQVTIQQLTGSLSTAFDTTAIALILLLIALPVLAYARRKEESFILDVETRLLEVIGGLAGTKEQENERQETRLYEEIYVRGAGTSFLREVLGISLSVSIVFLCLYIIWLAFPEHFPGLMSAVAKIQALIP